LERAVPLSRNVLFDNLSKPELPETFNWAAIGAYGEITRKLSDFSQRLSKLRIQSFEGSELLKESADKYRKTLITSISKLRSECSLTQANLPPPSWNTQTDISRRALDQYTWGKCDAAALLHIPSVFPPELGEDARKLFSIVGASTLQTKSSTKPNLSTKISRAMSRVVTTNYITEQTMPPVELSTDRPSTSLNQLWSTLEKLSVKTDADKNSA